MILHQAELVGKFTETMEAKDRTLGCLVSHPGKACASLILFGSRFSPLEEFTKPPPDVKGKLVAAARLWGREQNMCQNISQCICGVWETSSSSDFSLGPRLGVKTPMSTGAKGKKKSQTSTCLSGSYRFLWFSSWSKYSEFKLPNRLQSSSTPFRMPPPIPVSDSCLGSGWASVASWR